MGVRATPNADTIGDGVTILQHQLLLTDLFDHALQREPVLSPPVRASPPSSPTCPESFGVFQGDVGVP